MFSSENSISYGGGGSYFEKYFFCFQKCPLKTTPGQSGDMIFELMLAGCIGKSSNEPMHSKRYNLVCAPGGDSDQPAHMRFLIQFLARRLMGSQGPNDFYTYITGLMCRLIWNFIGPICQKGVSFAVLKLKLHSVAPPLIFILTHSCRNNFHPSNDAVIFHGPKVMLTSVLLFDISKKGWSSICWTITCAV